MIIEIENCEKTFKKNFRTIHALKGVSFRVVKNKILGILGPNGAGKTTLLKIITGIIQPGMNSGKILIFNKKPGEFEKQRLGFLPENPEFFKNITAYELLEFSLKITGTGFSKDRIVEVLEKVGLEGERNERVKTFSKGMRQRMGIAQAIIHSPELLILDEPMSGLDPLGRRMVIDLIRDYHRKGKTILFSTHDLDDIEALCTDVMVLNHGEILLEKSLRELRAHGTYKIEVEGKAEGEHEKGKQVFAVTDGGELWAKLEEIRRTGMQLIKVQSGIGEQLESYYKEGRAK